MAFEWDEKKRLANLRKHGFDFKDCARIFNSSYTSKLDVRFDVGEPRFRAVGLLNGRIVSVAYTERRNIIRVISMRKADQHEEADYFETFGGIAD